jgi:radical SAM superfamily enzyme YgiQ (UPF0313 family)
MRTLFLNPPHPLNIRLDIQRYTLRTRAGSLFPPIWLSWAAASVPNSRVVDAMAMDLTVDSVVSMAKDYDLITIQVDSATIDSCMMLAEWLKLNADSEVCFVGPHVSVLSMADQVMRSTRNVDYVARREYDYTVEEIAEGVSPERIPGLSYRKDGRICHNPDRPLIENLDDLPFVNPIYKRDLPMKVYRIHELRHPFTTIFSSRGCPFGCRYYCRWPAVFDGSKFRARSPMNVYEESRWVKENMPEIKEILFDEGTFTTIPKRVEEICALIKPLDLTWSCNARADVPLETLVKMKEAGCRLVIVGFESANPGILNTIRKGVTLQRMERFVQDCRTVGILVHGTFMMGLPGETKETIENSFKFAVKLDLDSIQFSVATPYPGTEFWHFLSTKGWLNNSDYLDENGIQQAVYDYPNLSGEEIRLASEKLHRRFMFRPTFIWKTMRLAFSNWDEMRRVTRGLYEYSLYSLNAGRKVHGKRNSQSDIANDG